MFPFEKIDFSGVKGIDKLSLTFNPDSKMNVFIGNNGVGKTKCLECLYQLLLLSSNSYASNNFVKTENFFVFNDVKSEGYSQKIENKFFDINEFRKKHNYPVIYIPALNRGRLSSGNLATITPLGEYEERKKTYFDNLIQSWRDSDSSSIEEWFVQRVLSGNALSSEEDNRIVELTTILDILHKIDNRIDNSPISSDVKPMMLHGGKSISFLVDGQRRRLNELSSGFASLVKIIQSIVSGYSFFTNRTDISDVEGIVLIDEIESHLHISWQAKIIPLLNKLFPNTIFIIATHSSLVLSQMTEGDAYRLIKENGIVINKIIECPSNIAIVDLLQEAFDTDINTLKIELATKANQEKQKRAILDLLFSNRGE